MRFVASSTSPLAILCPTINRTAKLQTRLGCGGQPAENGAQASAQASKYWTDSCRPSATFRTRPSARVSGAQAVSFNSCIATLESRLFLQVVHPGREPLCSAGRPNALAQVDWGPMEQVLSIRNELACHQHDRCYRRHHHQYTAALKRGWQRGTPETGPSRTERTIQMQ